MTIEKKMTQRLSEEEINEEQIENTLSMKI